MAHGYSKIEGKPMLALLHGTIGVQHAAMAIYNAYGDRVPIIMIAGNGDTAVPAHTAVDLATPVREYVKWDAQPDTLQGVRPGHHPSLQIGRDASHGARAGHR